MIGGSVGHLYIYVLNTSVLLEGNIKNKYRYNES